VLHAGAEACRLLTIKVIAAAGPCYAAAAAAGAGIILKNVTAAADMCMSDKCQLARSDGIKQPKKEHQQQKQ
jgi:3-deoxy-D-arabino-heptulosonate 7-phosphate (DAHP) synthase